MEIRPLPSPPNRTQGRARDLRKPRFSGLLGALLVASVACGDDDSVGPDAGGGFDDHTVGRVVDAAQFFELAQVSGTRAALKFIVTEFPSEATRDLRFMDSAFYTLHDEWYWFRLLNGEPIPGDTVAPYPGRFTSIAEIYGWAQGETTLPLDLQFVGDGRLYSPRFYRLSLSTPRSLGLGGMIHVAARTQPEPREEIWAFQVEFSDRLTHPDLVIFFEALEARLPADIARKLVFVTRSPWQETLAEEMRAQGLRYHDRVIRYEDLSVAGEVEVYNSGLTAGRVRFSEHGESLEQSAATDILVMGVIPDYLPPAAGLITSVPQTPLAHVNVLAKNRGIPNAYLGGAFDDLELSQLAYYRAPAIVEAKAPDTLRVVGIEESQYATWLSLRNKPFASLPPVPLEGAPESIDLSLHGLEDMDELRPLIGGKSAGFLALLSTDTVRAPHRPLALTIRPYVEHLIPMARALRLMLELPEFRAKPRVRYLFLEGQVRYDRRFTSADDRALRDAVLSGHPETTEIGQLLAQGGVAEVIEARALRPETKARLEATLAQHFSALDLRQGLRFRSSSTVEDIEGFNGAGLYDSNTGFFAPELQPDPNDHKKTLEWALKKTWASYWRFEAFEERQLENIDHLSGAMGVTVHPRFDDDKELANAVVTISRLPESSADELVLEVNVQVGPESVANPTAGILPEVDRVRRPRGQSSLVIERLRASTLVPAGNLILSDDELRAIFSDTEAVLAGWLAEKNRGLPGPWRVSTLTLDLELKKVAAGWPMYRSGEVAPEGLVLKQARPLEPGLRLVPDAVRAEAFPRDLLARASRVERRVCAAGDHALTVWTAFTDPLAEPDFGHAETPFVAGVYVAGPELSLEATHLDFGVQAVSPKSASALFELQLAGEGALRALSFREGVTLSVTTSSSTLERSAGVCDRTVELATPEDFLRSLLEARAR